MGGGTGLLIQGCCCLCAPCRRPPHSPLGYALLHDSIKQDIRRWLCARAAVRDPLCSQTFLQAMLGSVKAIRACQAAFTCKGLRVTPNVHFLNVREAPWGISPCSGLQPTVYGRAEEESRAGLPSRQACEKSCFAPTSPTPLQGGDFAIQDKPRKALPILAKAPAWDSR